MSREKRDDAIRTNVADISDPNVVRQNLFLQLVQHGQMLKLSICAKNVHLFQTYYTQNLRNSNSSVTILTSKFLHYHSQIWGQ